MFFEDASYKWSVDIVGKFCGIPVPDWGEFRDFNHLKGKNFHGGTVRRRAGRPEVAPGSGGIFRAPDKGIFLGRLDVGNRGTRSGIPVSSKSEQEVVFLEFTRNQQQQERQTAADSCRLC